MISDAARCSSTYFLPFFFFFFFFFFFPMRSPSSPQVNLASRRPMTLLPKCDPNDDEGTMKLIEELTTNAAQVQRQVLDEILARNSNTEYLHGFLHGLSGYHFFKKKVPVIEYEQVRKYIERIANGAPSSIICAQPITELLTSSGTSGGQPKMMPSTSEELDRKKFLYDLQVPVINKYVDGLEKGKGMYLMFVKPEIRTPSGLSARPVLTSYYKSSNFLNRHFNKHLVYTSPNETILCADARQSMYSQLLCGLLQCDDVLRVGAVFSSAFLRAIKFLEDHWQELCSNIRAGEISEWITDSGSRRAVMRIMREPNAELAERIEAECRKEPWEGIIRRLWPRTKYVDVIVTGSMAQYIPQLDFYSGGLPLVSTMYASSECYFGINLQPLSSPAEVSYTLIPNMAYFEFLPVKSDKRGDEEAFDADKCNRLEMVSEAVDLVDVEVGKCYELVVTTFTGLYRYRVGDILMVTGFHNSAPNFRFVHRRNIVLSIDTDKTNEADLLLAITAAKPLLSPLGFLLSDYTSFADTSSIPGHYILFWELNSNNAATELDPAVMEACCLMVEESLDWVYRRCRSRDRSVGALEIRVVRPGAFDALMDLCLNNGSSVNQYKTPRCISSPEAIAVLDGRVVGRFFSRSAPHWEPCLRVGKN